MQISDQPSPQPPATIDPKRVAAAAEHFATITRGYLMAVAPALEELVTQLTALAEHMRPPTTADAPAHSPLVQAADSKRARGLPGEIGALVDGDARLHAAPWYPLRPGDLVHIAMEQVGDIAPWGETYVIGDGTEPGQLWMRLLHHTPTGDPDLSGLAGAYTGCSDEPLYEAWVEAGPQRITVIRDGAVIPNQAARR